MSPAQNWFDQGGKAYAQFRPEYPLEVSSYLASLGSSKGLAVDVGCGNGQLTTQLAAHFGKVIGLDPSADQLAHATKHDSVEYIQSPAEKLPLSDGIANLVSVAQAAHWFDLPKFYSESKRIAAPGAHIALVSYGVMKFDSEIEARFQDFYWKEIASYWPPERRLVDEGYKTIDFPFQEFTSPEISIRKNWNLAETLGYISTWSAVKKLRDADKTEILLKFSEDLTRLWGSPEKTRAVSWPVNMRVGKL